MSLTDSVVLGTIVLLGLYEIWTLVNHTPNDTISESVWKASRRPFIPFLAGMLCGHWFWRVCM